MYDDDHESNTLGIQKHAIYVQLVLALFRLSLQYQCVRRFVYWEDDGVSHT